MQTTGFEPRKQNDCIIKFDLCSRPLYVTVVYQGKYSHCMRIGVAVPLNSTVYRLRDAVSRETKIPMDQVLFPSLIFPGSRTVGLCYSQFFKDIAGF